MPGFWVRLLITACGLLLADWLLDGIEIGGLFSLFFAALVLGIVNALVRPVLLLLTLPITVITLGLFLLVLNGAMLGLAALLVPGFLIDGFFAALFGAVIISLTGMVANWFIGPQGKVEILVVRR
ncbi:MAG: phage holin family protein [Gammaproteobacteria bacterium]|jgi:putative membrane protein|nr:phage holin family protein [Gammaproteobacteria bacterium]